MPELSLTEQILSLSNSPSPKAAESDLSALEGRLAGDEPAWLSASVRAICSWFRGDGEKAAALIQQGAAHDADKTSLVFLLFLWRIGRADAAAAWFDRYAGAQDPKKLDLRAFDIAGAGYCGLFGAEAAGRSAEYARAWYDRLSRKAGFAESQNSDLTEFFKSNMPEINDGEYPALSSAVTNWEALKTWLSWTRARKNIADYFNKSAAAPNPPRAALEKRLNGIFTGLFDGSGRDSRVDLSASLIKDIVDAGRADKLPEGARKTLLSVSKPLIAEGFGKFDAGMAAQKPREAEVSIAGWSGGLTDFANPGALKGELAGYLERSKAKELAGARVTAFQWIALVCGVILFLLALPRLNPLFIAISFIPMLYWAYSKIEASQRARNININYADREAEAMSAFDKFAAEIRRYNEACAQHEEGVELELG